MSRLMRDGTAEPVSRDQILRRKRGQGDIHFPCSADHEQDWQPYPDDPYSCYMCDHTYMYFSYRNTKGTINTNSSSLQKKMNGSKPSEHPHRLREKMCQDVERL